MWFVTRPKTWWECENDKYTWLVRAATAVWDGLNPLPVYNIIHLFLLFTEFWIAHYFLLWVLNLWVITKLWITYLLFLLRNKQKLISLINVHINKEIVYREWDMSCVAGSYIMWDSYYKSDNQNARKCWNYVNSIQFAVKCDKQFFFIPRHIWYLGGIKYPDQTVR